MKSAQNFYYAFMNYASGLFAILALGGGLVLAGFGETHNAMFALGLAVILGALSTLYREMGKPKNWSNSRARAAH